MRVITKLDDRAAGVRLAICDLRFVCHENTKNTKVWKGKIYIKSFYTVSMVIETKVAIGWFKLQLKMWLVDLNYNFECDWLIELSNYKLSDNNLTSELVENRTFLNQSQSRKL